MLNLEYIRLTSASLPDMKANFCFWKNEKFRHWLNIFLYFPCGKMVHVTNFFRVSKNLKLFTIFNRWMSIAGGNETSTAIFK